MEACSYPVRRWSLVEVVRPAPGGPGIASGQTLGPFQIPIPRTGYLVAVRARVYDPTSNTNETINLTVAETVETVVRVNNESPTNFQFLGLSTLGDPKLRPLIFLEKNDDFELDVRNTRTAGNDLYVKIEFGFCDPSDVERDRRDPRDCR